MNLSDEIKYYLDCHEIMLKKEIYDNLMKIFGQKVDWPKFAEYMSNLEKEIKPYFSNENKKEIIELETYFNNLGQFLEKARMEQRTKFGLYWTFEEKQKFFNLIVLYRKNVETLFAKAFSKEEN